MSKINETWISLNAHVGEQQNSFLRDIITPFLSDNEELINSFFFLRYWLGGPHLRLRFRCEKSNAHLIINKLQVKFERWKAQVANFHMLSLTQYKKLQVKLAELEGMDSRQDEHNFISDPRLIISTYEPEVEKYGGTKGVEIAEKLWCESSLFCLKVNELKLLENGNKLNIGFLTNIIGVSSFEFNLNEAAEYFNRSASVWQHYCPANFTEKFTPAFKKQATRLSPTVNAIWQGEFKSPSFNLEYKKWLAAMAGAKSAIDIHFDELQAGFSKMSADLDKVPVPALKSYLLIQYIHTHNNRLGVNTIDEWHVARLAEESVNYILSKDETQTLESSEKY